MAAADPPHRSGTSDRPALAVATNLNLTVATATLRMAWKGARDDQGIYESTLENNIWTPQQGPIPGRGSSHSPAIAPFPLHDGTPSTGLIMALKGARDDQGLYYATDRGAGWSAQKRIPNVGSSHRPALALFDVPYLAWKGVGDDPGIYWSKLTTDWTDQQRVPNVGTSNSPALVVFQDKLHMFWKGLDGDQQAYFSRLDAAPGAEWEPQKVVQYPVSTAGVGGLVVRFVSIGTSHGLSATQHGDRILLAWKGREEDSGIYFSLFDGNEFTGQIRVGAVGTTQGPGVCRIGTTSHMAWKGLEGDSVIYWSTL